MIIVKDVNTLKHTHYNPKPHPESFLEGKGSRVYLAPLPSIHLEISFMLYNDNKKPSKEDKEKGKGFQRVVEFIWSHVTWLGGIAITTALVDVRLLWLSIPATLTLCYYRDSKMMQYYLDVKSGKARNYKKCNDGQIEAFVLGVKASKGYLNQFKSNNPCSQTWNYPEHYYAGLMASFVEDEEFIQMMKQNRKNRMV